MTKVLENNNFNLPAQILINDFAYIFNNQLLNYKFHNFVLSLVYIHFKINNIHLHIKHMFIRQNHFSKFCSWVLIDFYICLRQELYFIHISNMLYHLLLIHNPKVQNSYLCIFHFPAKEYLIQNIVYISIDHH